jgi:hypothetical protein
MNGTASTAPLMVPSPARAQKSRTTGVLTIKPPSLGEFLYWDTRKTGYALCYKKRNKLSPTGWDYLYLGFWSKADMLALTVELSADDLLKVLRVEANRNAKLYLKRKEERDA